MDIQQRNSDRRVLGRFKSKYRNKLRQCRLKAMIRNQEELSKLTGIDRTTISAIENQRLFLSTPYALVFKEALGCSLDDLFEEVETEQSGNE